MSIGDLIKSHYSGSGFKNNIKPNTNAYLFYMSTYIKFKISIYY